jgi:uncharacterized membrane-anchored protein
MIRSLSPAKKLAIVIAVQFLILLSVIGFKQYTIWTAETVLLKTTPVDPRDLLRGDIVRVQYEISTIDLNEIAGDDQYGGTVYIELQRGDDGYWHAMALHDRRERSFDGTVLIKGDATYYGPGGGSRITVNYGIEQVYVPAGRGADLPSGRSHTVAVEVKVDRFGNAVPRRFFVDGQPFDLSR